MGIIHGNILNIESLMRGFDQKWKEPTESEKKVLEMKNKIQKWKIEQEMFLRDREVKERRLLYAIAEKLGIDVDNI